MDASGGRAGFPLARVSIRRLTGWHRLERITEFAGALPRLLKRLHRWVFQGRVAALIRSVRHLVGAEARSEEARQEWLGYPAERDHARAIPAVDRLRPQGSPASRALRTHGPGAREKNLEIFIARRFQRWAMRWTRRGAQRLRSVGSGLLARLVSA